MMMPVKGRLSTRKADINPTEDQDELGQRYVYLGTKYFSINHKVDENNYYLFEMTYKGKKISEKMDVADNKIKFEIDKEKVFKNVKGDVELDARIVKIENNQPYSHSFTLVVPDAKELKEEIQILAANLPDGEDLSDFIYTHLAEKYKTSKFGSEVLSNWLISEGILK